MGCVLKKERGEMRKSLFAANWKMYKTAKEAREMVQKLLPAIEGCNDRQVVVCPPYTALLAVAESIKGSNIGLGAQNMHWDTNGAYTGEVSAPMLKDTNVHFVVIGHSERRQYFGETNEHVNKKMKAAFHYDLTPIVCVGETLAEREAQHMRDVVKKQVLEGLKDLADQPHPEDIVVAYEPVWAIGTGQTATPQQAQEVHAFIRELLGKLIGDRAQKVRILYGGSIKPQNVAELMQEQDIDGGLVGGASLRRMAFILFHFHYFTHPTGMTIPAIRCNKPSSDNLLHF